MKIIVENTEPRLRFIGIGGTQSIRLMPGANEVEAEQWDRAKRAATIQWELKNGVLKETVPQLRKGKEQSMLAAMSTTAAAKLIGNTFNLEQLNTWMGEDGRPQVQKALRDQADLIHAAGEVEKKD